jgi:hypothetical protein
LPDQKNVHFVSNRFLGERFGFPYVNKIMVCDVFFVGSFINVNPILGVSLLNSTFSYLVAEVISRKTYGIGVAYIYGPEVNNIYLVNPSILAEHDKQSVERIFNNMRNREILSIFEELGFQKCTQRKCNHPEHPYEYVKPEEVSFDRIMPDRRELDKIVFEALGLTEEEQLEVYRAVLELVKNRLLKAKSK